MSKPPVSILGGGAHHSFDEANFQTAGRDVINYNIVLNNTANDSPQASPGTLKFSKSGPQQLPPGSPSAHGIKPKKLSLLRGFYRRFKTEIIGNAREMEPDPLHLLPIEEIDLAQQFPGKCGTSPEIYVRTMLATGEGLPCWNPIAPNPFVPRVSGISPGDIGTYCIRDGFKHVFNLWSEPHQCPRENCSLRTPLPLEHMPTSQRFVEGDTLAIGASVDVDYSSNKSGRPTFQFHCSSNEGAVLAVTSSANLETIKNVGAVRDFILQHAEDIYRHALARGDFEHKQPLYIVTGGIKTDSWAMGAYGDRMQAPHDTLQLILVATSAGQQRYIWSRRGKADARCGRPADGDSTLGVKNQGLFLRGFKLSISDNLWGTINGNGNTNTGSLPDGNARNREWQGPPGRGHDGGSPGSSHSSSNSTSGGTAGPNGGGSHLITRNASIQSFPYGNDTLLVHPSDYINEALLEDSGADFALSHDDWRSEIEGTTLNENSLKTLMTRLDESRQFSIHRGTVVLVPKVEFAGSDPRRIRSEFGRSRPPTEALFEAAGTPSPLNGQTDIVSLSDSDGTLNEFQADARQESLPLPFRSGDSQTQSPTSLSSRLQEFSFGYTTHESSQLFETHQAGDSPSAAAHADPFDGFDSTWHASAAGIQGLDWDQSELQNIVEDFEKHALDGRGSTSTRDKGSSLPSADGDTFLRHLEKWAGPRHLREKTQWTFKLEKPAADLRQAPHHEPSSSAARHEPNNKQAGPEHMVAVGVDEGWSSYANGRYRVVCPTGQGNESTRHTHQRLEVHQYQAPTSLWTYGCGPSSTIRKLSKADGFSITRQYHIADSSERAPAKPPYEVLLAPLRVQEQYTRTTVTRRLQSHGLLDPPARSSLDGTDKSDSGSSKAGAMHTYTLDDIHLPVKGKEKGDLKSSRCSWSSKGSTASLVSLSPPRPGPPQTDSFIEPYALQDNDALAPDHEPRWGASANPYTDDGTDEDEDDMFLGGHGRSRRTSHSDAFSVLPSAAFEQSPLLRQPPRSRSIFGWRKSKAVPTLAPRFGSSYQPPWAITSIQHSTDAQVIDTTLDPSLTVGRGKRTRRLSKRKKPSQSERKVMEKRREEGNPSVFGSFSPDFPCMILPLWPGETNFHPAEAYPNSPTDVTIEARKYLLVYYKLDGTSSEEDRTPKASNKSKGKKSDKGPVSFSRFHVCVRVVSHADLQGTGVRCPEKGLSIDGPLHEAFGMIPSCSEFEELHVIGWCMSREGGVEFIPECLEKLGLARRVPDPDAGEGFGDAKASVDASGVIGTEGDDASDCALNLTAIGRAVVEMVWLGALALMTFPSDWESLQTKEP